jgi:hypothetical protein
MHLRNVASGRYLALTSDRKVEMHAEADEPTALTVHGTPHNDAFFRHGDLVLATSREIPRRPAAMTEKEAGTWGGVGIEGSPHTFIPDFMGGADGRAWAWRANNLAGFDIRCAVVSRWLGAGKVETRDATLSITLPAHGRAVLAIAVPGDCKQVKNKAKTPELCRDEGLALLDALTPEKAERLSAERVAAWKTFWGKTWIDTGDALVNRYWFTAFHRLRCASRAGHVSPSM